MHGCTVYATDKDNPAIPKETNMSIVVPYIVQGTYDCKVTWNEYQNGSLVSKTVGPLSGLSVNFKAVFIKQKLYKCLILILTNVKSVKSQPI